MNRLIAARIAATVAAVLAPPTSVAQEADSLRSPRPARAYDVVRVRRSPSSTWLVGTVTAAAGDTLIVILHAAPPAAPALRIALDTIADLERRVILPGSRAMAAVEGLYWGTIAGGVVGWLGGAAYGALAGGTTLREGGQRGMMVGAAALGIGGAITLGARHNRGENGPESIRVEWIDVPIARTAGRAP